MKRPETSKKHFVEEESLIEDAYRLAVAIFESGFRPSIIVGIWRGGSTIGIYVQECLQYLGLKTDHIAIRTSYRGMHDYLERFDRPEEIRVHGLQYLIETMNRDDTLLLVDDVFSTGRNIAAVLARLESKVKRNMPTDVRVATVYYKPGHRLVSRGPDYYIHATESWLVFPYELNGLSRDDIAAHKPWALPFLEAIPDSRQESAVPPAPTF
jgi:hypoxanthine phosphoribosyltransferase